MQESVIYNEIIEQGEKKTALEIVLPRLKRRFGAVDELQEARLSGLSVPQLEQPGEDLPGFQAPADFEDWLPRNAA